MWSNGLNTAGVSIRFDQMPKSTNFKLVGGQTTEVRRRDRDAEGVEGKGMRTIRDLGVWGHYWYTVLDTFACYYYNNNNYKYLLYINR